DDDDDDDEQFTDALDHFTFSNHSTTPSTQHLKHNNQFSLPNTPETPDPNPLPLSTGIRRRSLYLHQNPKKNQLKNSPEHFEHVNVTPAKEYKFLLNFKETDTNSINYITERILSEDGFVNNNDHSVTVDSVNSVSSVRVVKFVMCPVWVVTNPLRVMSRAKGHVTRHVLRNKSVGRLCVKVVWGVLCAALVGLGLVCLLVLAFVVGGVVMRFVVEAPVSRIARLSFDYTKDAPMAFVPLMGCSGRDCFRCDEKIGYGDVGVSRVVPLGRKLQATVSLTLPESGYNRNLGNFQVRLDYLSSNGKSLATATQPCTMRFKSRPIRLLMMLFYLVPLITGYSSESQTVDIKFNGYTERKIPTSCVRVVLEPRAEFAKGGGVPEIYTAYVKLESQLPLLKRILWSWKATVFVWTSIAIFMLLLVFMLLYCAPWLWLRRGAPLNNTGSRCIATGSRPKERCALGDFSQRLVGEPYDVVDPCTRNGASGWTQHVNPYAAVLVRHYGWTQTPCWVH
ncbi:hypothetical protein M8C21_018720, partial [Ambrosia artemisiifolia]